MLHGPSFGPAVILPVLPADAPRAVKRVVIAGYYGFGNTGDEAILAALLSDLQAREPGLSAVVLAEDTAGTASTHGVAAIHWRDVAGIARAIRGADLVLLGGGGLF